MILIKRAFAMCCYVHTALTFKTNIGAASLGPCIYKNPYLHFYRENFCSHQFVFQKNLKNLLHITTYNIRYSPKYRHKVFVKKFHLILQPFFKPTIVYTREMELRITKKNSEPSSEKMSEITLCGINTYDFIVHKLKTQVQGSLSAGSMLQDLVPKLQIPSSAYN